LCIAQKVLDSDVALHHIQGIAFDAAPPGKAAEP
jgi:hypothetical protein